MTEEKTVVGAPGATERPTVAGVPTKIDGEKDLGRGVLGAASAAGVADGGPGRVADGGHGRVAGGGPGKVADERNREFLRAENEDDDGYDPYSDRRPDPEPLFERDPWS